MHNASERPNKDLYFMGIAQAVSARATCARRKVGAVLVRDGHVISSGYNGSPEGLEHCIDIGCDVVEGHCVRCVHAEANAIIQAGQAGGGTQGATLYTTASPCRRCMGLAINARIVRIVYGEEYIDPTHTDSDGKWAFDTAKRLGIELTKV
jgi:dCMP deaminase